MPKVSVVIPTYNRAELVREAVQSVLHQTFTDFEVVVVDDGSTDNTRKVIGSIDDPRVKYLTKKNEGPAAARNVGIRNSKGEFVAFLDSDDLSLEDRLSLQMSVVDERLDIGLVYGLAHYVKSDGQRRIQGRCYSDSQELMPFGPKIHLSTVLMRRDWAESVGGFDEKLSVAEDRDFLWRLYVSKCPMTCIPKPLVVRRQQEQSLTRNYFRHIDDIALYIEKIFNDPRMPDKYAAQRNISLANHLILAASSAYSAGKPKIGQRHLEQAIRVQPAVVGDDSDRFIRRLANSLVRLSPSPRHTLKLINNHPPKADEFTNKVMRQLSGLVYLELAFRSFRAHQRQQCLRHVLHAITQMPTCVADRGVLSIFVRSLVGRPLFPDSTSETVTQNKTRVEGQTAP